VSGEGNSAALINGPTFVNNDYISFDGINDYAPFTTEYAFTTGNGTMFSLEMWFQMRTLPTAQYAANGHIWGGENGNDVVVILNPASNGVSKGIICYDDSRYNAAMMTTGGFEANTWYQWVITGNGTNNTVTHYINGELDRGPTGVLPTSQYVKPWNGTRFALDTRWNTYSTLNLSVARQYMKELTASEVLQNYYQAPIVTDGLVLAVDAGNLVSYEDGSTTAYSLTGSLGGTLTNSPGYSNSNGGVFISDGTDDGIVVPDDNTLDLSDFTIEAWVWWNQHKNYGSLLCKGPGGSGQLFNYAFFFYSGNIVVGFGNGSSWYPVSIGTPSTNEWHHIVGTYDGATLKFYLDGVLANSSGIVQTPYQNNTDLGLLHTPYPIDGKVGPLRVYNRALTAAEVTQNYNAQVSRFQ
jgi:hypothetical protein